MHYHTAKRRDAARREIDKRITESYRDWNNDRAFQSYHDLVQVVRASSDLLSPHASCRHTVSEIAETALLGLRNLAWHHKQWQRSCTGWKPTGNTPMAVFSSLVRFLIDAHPVPPFMMKAWLVAPSEDGRKYQAWYIHMARTGTIRGTSTPCTFDRRQAKSFAEAPDHLTFHQAISWGRGYLKRGQEVQTRPVSVSRRKWKVQQAETQTWRRGKWKSAGLRGYHYDDSRNSPNGYLIWSVREILDPVELNREGEELEHCVGSYDDLCAIGCCSIWSVKQHSYDGAKRELTIEVNPARKQIVTALGLLNSRPKPKARRIMEEWARINRLKIASCV